jgi:hypothetical protein
VRRRSPHPKQKRLANSTTAKPNGAVLCRTAPFSSLSLTYESPQEIGKLLGCQAASESDAPSAKSRRAAGSARMSCLPCEIDPPSPRREPRFSLCQPSRPSTYGLPFCFPVPARPSQRCDATLRSPSASHQPAMRGPAPRVDCASRSPKRVRLISYTVSISPFPLSTASGEFLRPAASCLLLFRFLPKNLRE